MISQMLIAIPTYNERENLESIHQRIRRLPIQADILIVDDNSPDGTGEIAQRLSGKDSRLYLMRRSGKLGIGSAHLDAIHWAYKKRYACLLTMDCDFTHQPEDIPIFISSSKQKDVVIGTRFVDSQSLKDWEPFRKMVTHLGHFLTKKLLKMPYDASGAFRLYHLDRIPEGLFDLVRTKGYAFFFESLFILNTNGHSIQEIPIILPARTCGHSKMNTMDAVKGLSRLATTFLDSKIHP